MGVFEKVFLIAVLLSFSSISEGKRHSLFALRPPEVAEDVKLPPALWFKQYLDHFDPTRNTLWKQRYYVNDKFYEPGGPIFLMIGGEGPASPKWMVNGSWIDYAKRFNAFLVQLEHRYYGESHPTRDLSTKNLRYLSSEQALADLALFTTRLKEDYNLTGSKVISFGGSYPGSLAVWFRLKYPHVVHASISSSAPLIAHINFKEYLDVVTASISGQGSLACIKEISKATRYISLLLLDRLGWKDIEKLFRLCHPLDGQNTQDVSNLYESLAESFEDVVQYNKDNREFEGAKGTNITIKTLCNIMTNSAYGNSLQRYAYAQSLLLNTTQEKCLDHSYGGMIKELQKTSWKKDADPGGRAWFYQTCTEFGFYQSSDSIHHPFGSNFPIKFFLQQCSDIFGRRFSVELLKRGVERTNIMYGGKDPKVSRVVLINGSIDPWHYLGLTKTLNPDVPTIFINGTAHCANMYPESFDDPPQLKNAREDVANLIAKWLSEDDR